MAHVLELIIPILFEFDSHVFNIPFPGFRAYCILCVAVTIFKLMAKLTLILFLKCNNYSDPESHNRINEVFSRIKIEIGLLLNHLFKMRN